MRLNYPNIQPDRYQAFSLIRLILKTCRSLVNHSKACWCGMRIPLSWAHEKLGIPQPADDKEPILGIQKSQHLI